MGLRDWFRTRKTPDPTLLDLYERTRRLEVDMRELERAQQEQFDSSRRLLAKIVKRAKREAAGEDESLQDAPESTNGVEGHLTPSEIFRRNQLLKRR